MDYLDISLSFVLPRIVCFSAFSPLCWRVLVPFVDIWLCLSLPYVRKPVTFRSHLDCDLVLPRLRRPLLTVRFMNQKSVLAFPMVRAFLAGAVVFLVLRAE